MSPKTSTLLRTPFLTGPGPAASPQPKHDRPHFAFPFQRDGVYGILTVEQGTTEHVDACCQMIIRCPLGFREDRPDFGWPWPEFNTTPIELGPLQEALSRLEPRAVPDVTQYQDAAEAAVQHIAITGRATASDNASRGMQRLHGRNPASSAATGDG